MKVTHRSICRCCVNRCAIQVTVEDDRVTHVIGDRDDPMYGGYSCVKGRSQPGYLSDPDRILTSLKRMKNGRLAPIPIDEAMNEIAESLLAIRAEYGPRSIAGYWGTMKAGVAGAGAVYKALLRLIGTPMDFDPITIDKGGKQVAASLFGRWMAPSQGFDRPDVALIIGANPLLTYTGFPVGNPNRWLKQSLERGMRLIVIDPRRSEVGARASLYLQTAPGHDPEILAAMIRVIIEERRFDEEFVRENVQGIEALQRAVAPFTPDEVGRRADLSPDEIMLAARMFADAHRGYAWAGTGPSMAGAGTLTEYLVLVLETLCGHWLRAGEVVQAAPTLLPVPDYKAQAQSPQPRPGGEPMRVRSLTRTAAGMPTAALADEILLEGDGQVKALLSWNGNPAVAFPDQLKTMRALKSLELFVQVDPWMTATAQLATYVIAPTMPLEVASSSLPLDESTILATGYGTGQSYANYTPAIVEPPTGSDVIEEWAFFKGLYLRIESELRSAGEQTCPTPSVITASSTDELLDAVSSGSRVSLDEVRRNGGGKFYPDENLRVAEKEENWLGRLDVGNHEMLAALTSVAATGMPRSATDSDYPFRLLCRRMNHVYNSSCNFPSTNRGKPYNPAFMHPDDLDRLGLSSGDLAEIASSKATIVAIVESDPTARRRTVAMSFGFGGAPDGDHLVREIGSSPSRLVADDEVFDPYIGQPRMSNVPVKVSRCTPEVERTMGDRHSTEL
jgi:anaerobic selenocysteine-containing dehydrogenase